MQDFLNRHVLLGVCGGIAAYKAAYLARQLRAQGALVRVVMTEAATEFVSPLTFQALTGHPVRTALVDADAENGMGHIELAQWADYLVIAPASAHTLAKLALGLADDLLSTLYLVTRAPVIICPAMNEAMWLHPAVLQHVNALKAQSALVISPDEGEQACGAIGPGRLPESDTIIDAMRLYSVRGCLTGQAVLITAGPTRESIDPVRYLSNHSSGKMGYALAKAAYIAGAQVTLVSGPTDLPPPNGVNTIAVTSAQDMHDAVMASLKPNMIFIGCAAVADYTPETVALEKIKKNTPTSVITLRMTPDIVRAVVARKLAAYTVAFAAETQDVVSHATNKLTKKQVDLLVANLVGEGVGFGEESQTVTLLSPNCQPETWPILHKTRIAGRLIQHIAKKMALISEDLS